MSQLPTQKTCAKCGDGDVKVKKSEGGVKEGSFYERYYCSNTDCNARGRITGDASKDPQYWQKRGAIF